MIKVVIIEDEPHAQRELQRLLSASGEPMEVLAVLESVEDALDWLGSRIPPDLLFCDIQLGDGLSFEIFDQLSISAPVIFTTAYDQYALQAFKVHAIDYLLKPVEPEALLQALHKFKEVYQQRQERVPDYSLLMQAFRTLNQGGAYRERIAGKLGDKLVHHNIQDVAYFHASDEAITLYPFQGQRGVIDLTLDRLEEQLDPRKFFRINRNMLVNIRAVGKVQRYGNGQWAVELNPQWTEHVVVSRARAKDFAQWLDS